MSPTRQTIHFKKRAEELRARVRMLEQKGDLERAAWLEGIADCFEQMATTPPPNLS
jgi:hypothetical protein